MLVIFWFEPGSVLEEELNCQKCRSGQIYRGGNIDQAIFFNVKYYRMHKWSAPSTSDSISRNFVNYNFSCTFLIDLFYLFCTRGTKRTKQKIILDTYSKATPSVFESTLRYDVSMKNMILNLMIKCNVLKYNYKY